MRTAQKAVIAGVALLSLAFYLKTAVGSLGHTTFDDAYMITRYAKHWLAGQGFSWNPHEGPVYGITSPAYLIVVTAILGLTGCTDAMAVTAASFSAGLMSMLTLVLLGFFIQERRWRDKSWVPLLVVPCLCFLPPFRYHSLTGMETTTALFANSLLAVAIVIATRRRGTAALVFCLGAGTLSFATRPDNGVYAFCLPPILFVATSRSLWRYAVQYECLAAAIAGCGLIINRLLFGDFLPLPFFVKRGGFYQGYVGAFKWNAMEYMLDFCVAAIPCLLVLVCTIRQKAIPQIAAIGVAVLVTFGYYATVMQLMGWQSRYYYPSIAFCFLAAFISIELHAATPTLAQCTTISWRSFAGLMILLPVLSPSLRQEAISRWEKHVIGNPKAVQCVTQYRRSTDARLPSLGWWNGIQAMGALIARMPPGIAFASSEYGQIGSRFPDLTIVDLTGLHDRTIAHHGFSTACLFSRSPDLVWFPHGDYTHAVALILDDPVFRCDYEYYPQAYDYGIALRKTSKVYATMKKELEREFVQVYADARLSECIAEPVDGDGKPAPQR